MRRTRRRRHADHARRLGATRRHAQLALQRLNGTRILVGQAGIDLLGLRELGAGEPRLAFFRVQLRLDVVRLGTFGMIAQHLIHHGLRLIVVTRLGGLVDLVHRRIGGAIGGKHGQAHQTCESQGRRSQG